MFLSWSEFLYKGIVLTGNMAIYIQFKHGKGVIITNNYSIHLLGQVAKFSLGITSAC